MNLKPNDLSLILHVRDQIHVWHLQTRSHAQHATLGAFYPAWLELADGLIETDAGPNPPATPTPIPPIKPFADGAAESYLSETVAKLLEDLYQRTANSPGLQNIVADMMNLVAHTIYKLQQK